MGLSSLIAPINILANQGWSVFLIYLAVGMVLPALIAISIHHLLRMAGKVHPGDLKLEVQ